MPRVEKTYNAEVVLTVNDPSIDTILSEEDVRHAAIEAEMRVNSLGDFEYCGNTLGLSMYIKGEKNGNNQN